MCGCVIYGFGFFILLATLEMIFGPEVGTILAFLLLAVIVIYATRNRGRAGPVARKQRQAARNRNANPNPRRPTFREIKAAQRMASGRGQNQLATKAFDAARVTRMAGKTHGRNR